MKKKIMLFLFMMLVPILGVKADTIKKIDMRINILEDGSAEIKEVWNVKASSGSEWYKQMYNLGEMKLSNYKVLMDGKELTYKTWNVNENLSQKAGYYGINYVSEGIELCFGKSDMKEHTFTLTYTLSNFVFNTEDSQVVYVTLFPEVTMQNFTVEVSSYYEFPDTLDVWGYGYKGYAYVENGLIKMSNEGELSNDYVVLLAKFPLNTFKTDYTVEDYNTFDDVYNKSEDGSFDYDYTYKKTFWDYVIIIFNIIICGIFPLLIVVFAIKAVFDSGYGYINNKKIDKKNTQMFRDIPCNKDIYYANALISLNKNIFTYKESNILGAILLKWIRNDKVRLTNQTKGIFNKETSVIDLTMNPTFDNENEEKLFKMMYKASGDGILEAKELEKWCRSHYDEFLNIFKKFENEKISRLKNEGHIYKRTTKEECKKKNVMDDKIYEDSTRLYGLKLYLDEFSRMKEKDAIEVKLWDEYLMFAYLFGIADKVAKQFKNLYPEIIQEMEMANVDYSTLVFVNNISSSSVYAASSARSAAENYSSGGGGFSSGGGGGGSFGGGGSMGGR